MPWQKGIGGKIYPNVGRRGFELEEKEKRRLKRLLAGYLTLAEAIKNKTATENQIKAFERLNKLGMKILDKFAATKTQEEFSGELDLNQRMELDEKTKQLIEEFVSWQKSKS